MVVSELIEKLSKLPSNAEVKIYDYKDGKYYSNFDVDKSDKSINFYRGI